MDQGTYKLMSFASREDLVTWRAIMAADPDKGCNLANMLYVDSRLKLWRDQKNLAELEKELDDQSVGFPRAVKGPAKRLRIFNHQEPMRSV